MAGKSPYIIVLSSAERAELQRRSRAYTEPHYSVVRAKIVLLAAEGMENRAIAKKVDLPVQIVSRWRKRFFEERLEGLEDRPRTGRPPGFSP